MPSRAAPATKLAAERPGARLRAGSRCAGHGGRLHRGGVAAPASRRGDWPGVRGLSMAIACALVEDLDQLADLGPALDQQLPTDGPARQQLDAFQLGLERLVGLVALLVDARQVVYATLPDGRRMVDLFRLTETG